MSNYRRAMDLAEELSKYTSLESSSPAEACELLSNLARYPDYVSDEFYKHLVDEMEAQLRNYQDNCVIIEEEKEVKQIVKTKRLEWNDY